MSKRSYLLAASALAVTVGLSTAAQAVPAVGLIGGLSLFSFDTGTPGFGSTPLAITGLNGAQILGIDYRPATGALYGLTNTGALYTLNASTGVAVLASQLTTALTTGDFDISFNPTVDRLRIVGTSGQNLRVNVDTGAVTVDTPLAYAGTDVNAGTAPNIVGAAYTNQFANATATTLYDLDATNASLVTQAPPNNGTLNTVGPLGVRGVVSFDIDGTTGAAFAATGNSLYSVNLTSGAASSIGGFSTSTLSDFALTPIPEPMSLALLGAGVVGVVMTRRGKSATTAA